MYKNKQIPNSIAKQFTVNEKASIITERLYPNIGTPLTRILLRDVTVDILNENDNARISDVIIRLGEILEEKENPKNGINVICCLIFDLLPLWDVSLDSILRWSIEFPNNSQKTAIFNSIFKSVEMSGSEKEKQFYELYNRTKDFSKYSPRVFYIYSVLAGIDLSLTQTPTICKGIMNFFMKGLTSLPSSDYMKWVAESVSCLKEYDDTKMSYAGESGICNDDKTSYVSFDLATSPKKPSLTDNKILWFYYYINLLVEKFMEMNTDFVPNAIDYDAHNRMIELFWKNFPEERERPNAYPHRPYGENPYGKSNSSDSKFFF